MPVLGSSGLNDSFCFLPAASYDKCVRRNDLMKRLARMERSIAHAICGGARQLKP